MKFATTANPWIRADLSLIDRSCRITVARMHLARAVFCTALLAVGFGCGESAQPGAHPAAAQQGLAGAPLPLATPLATNGNQIVNAHGKPVRLKAINWFGGSDVSLVPGGLDRQHRQAIAKLVRDLGFNTVRLPFSNEMVRRNPVPDEKYLTANPDLIGKPALDVYEAVVAALDDAGVAVMLNNHTTSASWCCNLNPCEWQWANSGVPLCGFKQTEDDWIEDWATLAERTKKYPMVIGADLRNEIRPLFGIPWEDWARAVERASARLAPIDPRLLIVVEGLNSAQDFTGARRTPITTAVANKLVYSPHVYPWFWFKAPLGKVYGSQNYYEFSFSLEAAWGYLADTKPIWVGEFGIEKIPSEMSQNYWGNMVRYLTEHNLGFCYWPLNAERVDHGAEGYGILDLSWTKPNEDFRFRDLQMLF